MGCVGTDSLGGLNRQGGSSMIASQNSACSATWSREKVFGPYYVSGVMLRASHASFHFMLLTTDPRGRYSPSANTLALQYAGPQALATL